MIDKVEKGYGTIPILKMKLRLREKRCLVLSHTGSLQQRAKHEIRNTELHVPVPVSLDWYKRRIAWCLGKPISQMLFPSSHRPEAPLHSGALGTQRSGLGSKGGGFQFKHCFSLHFNITCSVSLLASTEDSYAQMSSQGPPISQLCLTRKTKGQILLLCWRQWEFLQGRHWLLPPPPLHFKQLSKRDQVGLGQNEPKVPVVSLIRRCSSWAALWN